MTETIQPDIAPESAPVEQNNAPTEVLSAPQVENPAAPEQPPQWPEKWRDMLAGDDAKFRKQLDRVKEPADFAKSYRELEKSKVQAPAAFPEDGDDDAKNAWREDNGIPLTPEDYTQHYPEGFILDDADKEHVGGFLAEMHKINATPQVVNAALGAYKMAVENQAVAQLAADKVFFEESQALIKEEWGAEYDSNVNMIKAFLGKNQDLEAVALGRDANGRVLAASPAFVRLMVEHIKLADPSSASVVGMGGSSIDTIESEIAKIRAYKMTPEGDVQYRKDPDLQKKYADLINKRDAHKK